MTNTGKIGDSGEPATPAGGPVSDLAASVPQADEPVTSADGRQSQTAAEIARGTTRFLSRLGYACLGEFPLPNGQRADITALSRSGKILIVEIKSSLNDFRTDQKWEGYREYCDELYFAVMTDFPAEVLPESAGLILADKYAADIVRYAPETPLAAARRKVLTLRFARASARRLTGFIDPSLAVLYAADPD